MPVETGRARVALENRHVLATCCRKRPLLLARIKKRQKKRAGEITQLQTCTKQKSCCNDSRQRKPFMVGQGSGAAPCEERRRNEDENFHPAPENDAEHDQQRDEDEPESYHVYDNLRDLIPRDRLQTSLCPYREVPFPRSWHCNDFCAARNLATRQS